MDIKLTDLVGVPFVDKGRDPQTGLDCWGLLIEVQKRYGRTIPDFDISCNNGAEIFHFFRELKNTWKEVNGKPEPGDGIALALMENHRNIVQHFGTFIGKGRFIHTLKETGVIISRTNNLIYQARIKGYYKWQS